MDYEPTADAWASYELAIELLRQRAEAQREAATVSQGDRND